MRTTLLALAAASLTALALGAGTGVADAASRTTPSSIALGTVQGSYAASTAPALGSHVTFVTSYSSTWKNPRVEVDCYQNGTLVWGQVGLPTDTFTLGGDSSPWRSSGGAASCVATLADMTWKAGTETTTWLADTRFSASA